MTNKCRYKMVANIPTSFNACHLPN
jgi:hypothetical protein